MSEEDRYEVFAKRMKEKYPRMFSKPHGGFAVGEGWWPIIESLCANIQSHTDWWNKNRETRPVVPQTVVTQVKEKFGGLCFYYDGGDEAVAGMVRMAESWASRVCEDCGAPATTHTTGWIKNVCDQHFEQRETARKERFAE
jgi:hypothetical protein